MPELPEVETALRGIKPYILNQKITYVIVRRPNLRWPIPANLAQLLTGQTVKQLKRRGKYLLLGFDHGTLILHLGMSGSLSVLPEATPHKKHDHVELHFANHKYLRFTDPRRFGAILWTDEKAANHPLISSIGPEPLTNKFDGDYLYSISRNKKAAIKSFIMDGKIVAGVGNIYATEALFLAGIHPNKSAGDVTLNSYRKLVDAIKSILKQAIKQGGTTLKDFVNPSGSPGYFSIQLHVYGRAGKSCPRCKNKLKSIRLLQRSTVYCPYCQKA